MAESGGERGKEEAAIGSASVSLLTYSGGGRLLKSPTSSVTRARLVLTREGLECRDEQQQADGGVSGYLLEDLVGVDLKDRPPPHDKNACQMNVHFYPKRTEKKKTVRRMRVLSVCFDAAETFSENRTEASKWKDDIKLHTHHIRSKILHSVKVEGETIDTLEGGVYG